MAIVLRLRRALAISSSIRPLCTLSSSSKRLVATPSHFFPRSLAAAHLRPHYPVQCCAFHSSPALADRRGLDTGDDRKISPDEILFEGCDYNHWLITMDFPDPKPSREEMIETYLQTLAKVVGSYEEAKKRMYACSTTTYVGFQAVMTEEMSEKFRGLPGVVFILPDSYIDPVNKEYGGDKYENGVITPRPPPIQYGRQGRARNQNRFDRPSYNRSSPQGNPQYDQQGPMQRDGGNYAPQQNYSQPGQDGRGYAPPRNFPQPGQDGRGYTPQQNYSQPGQDGRGYSPPGGRDFPSSGDRRDFGPGERRDYAQAGYQGAQWDAVPPQRNFAQGGQGNFTPQQHGNFSQGQGAGYGDYRQGSGPGGGDYGQGSGPGYSGDNRQGAGSGFGGDYRQR